MDKADIELDEKEKRKIEKIKGETVKALIERKREIEISKLSKWRKETEKIRKEERIKELEKYKEKLREQEKADEEKRKKKGMQILFMDLIIGVSFGLLVILLQNKYYWWSFIIVVLGTTTTIWQKTKIDEKTPGAVGDRYKTRLLFAIISWLSISFLIDWTVFSLIEMTFVEKISISIATVLIIAGLTWKIFTFEVPAWTGINLYNYFTGQQTTFFPGLHFKLPWELARQESTHSLKSIKHSLEESYPTGGGTVLIAKFMFQFRPDPYNLIVFEGVDNEVIKSGLVDHASSLLLSYIADPFQTAISIRNKIEILQETMRDKFGVDPNETRTLENPKKIPQAVRAPSPIERSYGIILVVASLNDLDFEPEYQKVLTSKKAMDEIQDIADSICEKAQGDMTRKEAWDEAMIVSGKSTGNIVKTTGGGQAIPFVNIGR